jgi:hypothetical protein
MFLKTIRRQKKTPCSLTIILKNIIGTESISTMSALARTPFFESRVDKYYEQLVYPAADSVIKEIDYMMGYASSNEEMEKFLLLKFVNRYLNQKYMWEDAVFVHLFEKYFSQKTYSWLTDKGKQDHYRQGLQFNGQYYGHAGFRH